VLASFSFDFGTPIEVVASSQQSTLFSMQHNAGEEFRLALDDITKLIDAGREKSHLTYNGVNDLIPHDADSPEDLDDLLLLKLLEKWKPTDPVN
jgi:hypothetical protein